jgi:hypothetical protein
MVTAYVGMTGIQNGYQVALALAAFERNNNDQRAAVLTMMSTSEQTDRAAAQQIIAYSIGVMDGTIGIGSLGCLAWRGRRWRSRKSQGSRITLCAKERRGGAIARE